MWINDFFFRTVFPQISSNENNIQATFAALKTSVLFFLRPGPKKNMDPVGVSQNQTMDLILSVVTLIRILYWFPKKIQKGSLVRESIQGKDL